jgi:hypothetical protein
MRPRNGTILCHAEKYIAIRPASTVAATHGRYGVRGCCCCGAGGKFAVEVIVSFVVLPEGLFAEIFAGLSVHVAADMKAGMAQLKFTSAGKVEPFGVVVKVSTTIAGVPGVICNVPGTVWARVKSTLERENVAAAAIPVTDAVTL